MKNDLISRSALLKMARRYEEYDEGGCSMTVKAVPVEAIEDAPAVDAAPVVHGRWESASTYEGIPTWMCNKCSHGFGRQWKYCPNCGAKMDGDL